jgi:hypothetical protein
LKEPSRATPVKERIAGGGSKFSRVGSKNCPGAILNKYTLESSIPSDRVPVVQRLNALNSPNRWGELVLTTPTNTKTQELSNIQPKLSRGLS